MGKVGVEGWGGVGMGSATFWGPVRFGQYVPSKSAMNGSVGDTLRYVIKVLLKQP